MMANAQLCKILKDGIDPDYYFNFTDNFIEKEVSTLNRITYAYIAPLIIAFGIVGDILTVITLTHPLLRRSSIVYTYLTLLAMTDLLTQISIIPMILWLLDRSICTRPTAYYYAHVGFPLVNALMGASVWIVVFLTFSQYMAVCRPFNYGMRSRKVCFILFFCAYIINFGIYAPWALKKRVWQIDVPPEFPNVCEYLVCDSDAQSWYALYAWIREAIARVIPFFLVAFFNTRILITYRNTKADRMKRLSNSQKRFVYEKSEQEERRLFVLLFAIIIVFCVCTIPAAPLTILVADSLSNNLPFQFALNFYFYCLINPDIRRICLNMMLCRKIGRPARVKGQPVNHISQYTRSTKSTFRGTLHESFTKTCEEPSGNGSRRSLPARHEYRRSSAASSNSGSQRSRSATITLPPAENVVEPLTVIRESDDCNEPSDEEREPNERTSML